MPDNEFIKIKTDAEVTISLGLAAFSKKSIGLKKIPPPIPTIPETKPSAEPIKIAMMKFNFLICMLTSLYDLLLINNEIPAIDKTRNNIISNKFLSIIKDPPKKASGIEPIKNGKRQLKL